MILLGLGANLPSTAGSPATTLRAALRRLANIAIVPSVVSQFYVSPAWPDPRDPAFVNAVATLETALEPMQLLDCLHRVEAEFGRVRSVRNAPRTLDLDLLDYHGRVEAGPPQLPHPRIAERGFVLVPLREVAPEWRHPVTGQAITSLVRGVASAHSGLHVMAP
jgi:2-amino-4-hydroxy-6-hydroxymethyldihydropteridine diphosphokinase